MEVFNESFENIYISNYSRIKHTIKPFSKILYASDFLNYKRPNENVL